MRVWITPVILCLVLTGCDAVATPADMAAAVTFRRDSTIEAYLGSPVTREDSIFMPLYYDALPDLGEPPLRGASVPPGHRVLRFTWIRSFHPMIVVRLIDGTSGCLMTVTTARPRVIDISNIPVYVPGDTVDSMPTPPTVVARCGAAAGGVRGRHRVPAVSGGAAVGGAGDLLTKHRARFRGPMSRLSRRSFSRRD